MNINDFQRIAKAVGMGPTGRDDMAEIASPDGEDGREWLTPRTGRVLRCRVWDAESGWLEPVAGGDAVDRLHGLVDELHGWAEAERTAWIHARSVTRLLDGRVGGLAGLA